MPPNLSTLSLAGLSMGMTSLIVYLSPQYPYEHFGLRIFLTVFATLYALSFVWSVILWPKFFSPLRKLPSPSGASFMNGHAWDVTREPTGMPMRRWLQEIPNEGLIRYNFFLNKERVLLTNPKTLSEVLVTRSYEFIKPLEARQGLGRILGVGVLLAEGEEHKIQRKNLQPAFSYRQIKDLYPTFWSKSAEMVHAVTAVLQQHEDQGNKAGTVIELSDWMSRCTLDIIGIAGLGYDFGSIRNPTSELLRSYRTVFTPTAQARMLALLGTVLPIPLLRLLPLQRNNDILTASRIVRAVSRQVIEEKVRALAEAKAKSTDEGGPAGKDILSVALESGAFSVENLVDQTMTFLAAGHETTATAMCWALICLAQNADAQARLRAEVRANLPPLGHPPESDSDRPSDARAAVTPEAIDGCAFLHAVCNEVLRFRPPAPLTRREATRDTTLAGFPIPAGTNLIVAPAAVNFSKELWGEDAEEFRPDRWMGGKRANSGGATSNYANLTFLHGPRSCIGQTFAKAEFACILAAVVGRFEFELEPKDAEIEYQSGLVQRPKGGVTLRMKVVDRW